ncbi:MFS transporter [Butyrivibrio sp. CB08]|uniref:MFS transporter n=1 Tax=Butyrivibrio sp. CB08 TaxID=2364879 RepID=UPI000EA93495|nr:MFS transporter [Butyrivibrio sp. CB08]RKM61257.1 MFS transporter [Butyrivibrio sp. CB08]
MKNRIMKLRDFYILWSTQSLSQLGSAMTQFALTLWIYEKTGSALSTASLSICTYAPYVIMSIFAGALTDKFDKKKTMLVCDLMAALTTVLVFVLYKTDLLSMWHLYAINMFSGLMNTVQQPASEVANTLIVPKDEYQKTSGLMSLSRSLISIGNPLIAAALYGIAGLDAVIGVDLVTFGIAFLALLLFIKLPEIETGNGKSENVLVLAKEGLVFLKQNPLVLHVILFMAGVNLTASSFDAVLPALVIPRQGNNVLGVVTACSGIAMVIGSFLPTVLPKPKDRVRVIYLTMLFSLGTENFLLAFSRNPVVWCFGQFLGWALVPLMAANQNVIMRNSVPVELQGRVYACRNTLQFFTIPIGLFLGGFFVDHICEPFMEVKSGSAFWTGVFGTGKGSGAALMMFILAITGIVITITSSRFMRRYKYVED